MTRVTKRGLRWRVGAGAAAVATATAFSLAALTPASAALSECPSGAGARACAWLNTSYSGGRIGAFQSNISFVANNNEASSVNNYLSAGTCWYDSQSYTSYLFSMNAYPIVQYQDAQLSNGTSGAPGINFNDRVGSAQVC